MLLLFLLTKVTDTASATGLLPRGPQLCIVLLIVQLLSWYLLYAVETKLGTNQISLHYHVWMCHTGAAGLPVQPDWVLPDATGKRPQIKHKTKYKLVSFIDLGLYCDN